VNVIARRICTVLPILLAILTSSIPSSARVSARIAPADILIVHAKVYTLNPQAPWPPALAIRRSEIVAVGSDEVVGRMRGIGTSVIDAGGKLVLPGFTDCHIYFLVGSLGLSRVNLETGKLADVIIVDRNVLEIDPQNIHETKVVFTIVGGKVVYEAATK
jgi:predicted amidohydrolase YtcJ